MRRRIVQGMLALALVLAAVGAVALGTSTGEAAPGVLAGVAADFDAHVDEVRVVAVLSPT